MKAGSARLLFLSCSLGLLLAGCSREAPPPAPPPEEPTADPTEFGFTATNEVVSAEALQAVQKRIIDQAGASSQKLSVEADFNKDGLTDLALVEASEQENTGIIVYIRKPAEADGEKVFYYRGGTIPCPGSCNIRGIMERRGKAFTDLVVLAGEAGGLNEIVLYRNDGTKFVRQDD